MARSRETKIELTAYDDLFQTDESREEAKLSKIRDIPISEIDEFPDHPFKVLMDEDMEQLVESIKRNGVMTPATVRLKEDGRYELISGHRRKKACELAGLETLKCEVKELTRDEAIIVMVESNLQRSVILPSEKAFAYADTVSAYINIETPTGTIALKKTSEDGVVEGISFTIKGDNFNKTVKTGKDGSVSVEGLFPGTYTVTEQSIDRYEPQKTQTVTLIGGKTSTVTFSNTLKRGSLEIVKTSEDNLVEGMKFHLYGTSLSGLPVDEYQQPRNHAPCNSCRA